MSHRRAARFAVVVVALVGAFWMASCSKSDSPTAPGGGGGGGGSVAPAPFNLTFPAAGRSVALTFPNAGTFGYHCTPHQGNGMTGTVNVSAGGVDDSVVVNVGPGNTLTFNPATVSLKPGGYVRWVNQSTMTNHTVTSN